MRVRMNNLFNKPVDQLRLQRRLKTPQRAVKSQKETTKKLSDIMRMRPNGTVNVEGVIAAAQADQLEVVPQQAEEHPLDSQGFRRMVQGVAMKAPSDSVDESQGKNSDQAFVNQSSISFSCFLFQLIFVVLNVQIKLFKMANH